jgi:hypothetical protein
MAQAVSRLPLTMKARVRARLNLCGICSGQSETGTGFPKSSLVFPCQYHSTVAFHTHIPSGVNNRPLRGRGSETFSPHRHEHRIISQNMLLQENSNEKYNRYLLLLNLEGFPQSVQVKYPQTSKFSS